MIKQLLMISLSLLVFTISFAPGAKASDVNPHSVTVNSAEPLQPFTINYRSKYKAGWFSFNVDAKRTLEQVSDNVWRLSFLAEASIATLKETSLFSLVDGQIVPIDYDYQSSGLIDDENRDLNFLVDSQTIRDNNKNQDIQGQWQDGIQDNLTYMLQASFFLAKQQTEFSLPVFEKKKTKMFAFQVVGEETIQLPAGTFKTLKVRQIRNDKNRKIHAWFAIQEGYPLIKLSDKKDGKERYRIEATNIKS